MEQHLAHTGQLAGCCILVVEDEPLVALDLCENLQDYGAQVIGPAMRVEEALALLADRSDVTAAGLAVQLGHELCLPLAAVLAARRLPFVFLTVHHELDLAFAAYAAVPRLLKPVKPSAIVSVLSGYHPAAAVTPIGLSSTCVH